MSNTALHLKSDSYRFITRLKEAGEAELVGGKAASLGRMIRAGFAVPDGFVITTAAFRAAKDFDCSGFHSALLPSGVVEEIRSSYLALGGGHVAVRSSATAEDMVSASMAGQYETFLNVEGEAELLHAVERCWASLNTPRVRAYLSEHVIDPNSVAMAVVVQRLVSADVAGVLFTCNPEPGRAGEMLLEASWGLGEAIVSGRVQPDVLRVDRHTGRVLSATIADKHLELAAGTKAESSVDESRRLQPCLNSHDVYKIWQLGKQVSQHFGTPQDIEWAIEAGDVYLLQSRPITTLGDAEKFDQALQETKLELQSALAGGRGPWAVHNLSETLPHPTPLTWSVISHFMSGAGAMGTMYRRVGFDPSSQVEREGFLRLIAGRVYMDLWLAPGMFFENFPFAYDLADLLHRPDVAQAPPTVPVGTAFAKIKAARRLSAVKRAIHALAGDLDRQLRDEVFPKLTRYVETQKQGDLQTLSAEQLIDRWQENQKVVLDEFGPELLLPSLICTVALDELRAFLAESFCELDPDALAQQLSAGGPPSCTLTMDSQLHAIGIGKGSIDVWLGKYGHRAPGEFDLVAPRWRVQPEMVREMAARLASEDPLVRYRKHAADVECQIDDLREQLPPSARKQLDERLALVHRYMAFREDAKEFLMLGYDLLRSLALEIGRRLEIGDDVFYLMKDELFDALRVGFAPIHLIAERKSQFQIEEEIALPRVIDAQAIESLGKPAEPMQRAGDLQGLAISGGAAVGPACIVKSPLGAGQLEPGYILVCPSTDPSWTPLFASAAGLVLECGGMLSHGAVVAREMGLPAVVLPDATQIFSDGEQLRVDGDHGIVGTIDDESALPHPVTPVNKIDPSNTHIAFDLLPPPVGSKERKGARVRNWVALAWIFFLAAFFSLPPSIIREPAMAALDFILWPLVRLAGKPATVAIVAAGIAIGTMLLQKLVTDNRRLLVAKSRAAALRRQAQSLPVDSPRRSALLKAANSVPARTTMAALVPIGILLGPLVLPFVWFKVRIDPAVAVAVPGSSVQIVATVEGEWTAPVRLQVPERFAIDVATPAERTLPPIRQTLEHLLALYSKPSLDSKQPWELQTVPDLAREQSIADLSAYLAAGVPPQAILWQVTVPQNANGNFNVAATTTDHMPLGVSIVVGDSAAPAATAANGTNKSPIKQLRVVYPPTKQEPEFWRPFASQNDGNAPFGTLTLLDIGWLWIYLLVYVPTLFIARKLLHIA